MSPESSHPVGSIDVEHLWKRFRSDKAVGSLRDRLSGMRPRPAARDKHRFVLRDIELHMEPGDALGLIGSNGCGKSTLLKILTGVMYPYAGVYSVRGRVGALLEVRAGLHSDLSGRENIYLYGGLLGLSRAEVAKRFDDIVEFAVLEDAIDRQVKFYSSGMGMRLGFSVAAFLEPDILLVDEALAVGDAFFQQRCLDRMRDLLAQGTTLVLVSHDLAAVESVCGRGLWLKDGAVMCDTDVRGALTQYRTWLDDAYHEWIDDTAAEAVFRQGTIEIIKADVAGPGGSMPQSQKELNIDIVLDTPEAAQGELCIGVTEGTASPMFIVTDNVALRQGHNSITCSIPHLPVAAGRYYLWLSFEGDKGDNRIPWQPTGLFTIEGRPLDPTPIGVMRSSPIQLDASLVTHDDA